MYKCSKCGKDSQPGEPLFIKREYHEVWDERQEKYLKQIKSEVPLCKKCYQKHIDNSVGSC